MTKARRDARDAASQRRTRGRPPVPLDRIVTCALELLDHEGAGALSMRALAERLGSGTAVLYRNVGSRASLIAHVVDRVFGEVELDASELAEMGWERACRKIAKTMFAVLNRHPHVTPLLVEQVPLGPNALELRERCLAVLLGAEFSAEQAARFYTTLARYVLGFAIQRSAESSRAETTNDVSTVLRDIDRSHFPATVAVAGSLPISIDAEFNYGLELLITGARVERKPRSPR